MTTPAFIVADGRNLAVRSADIRRLWVELRFGWWWGSPQFDLMALTSDGQVSLGRFRSQADAQTCLTEILQALCPEAEPVVMDERGFAEAEPVDFSQGRFDTGGP